MADIQCEQCGYVDAESKFIHLPEYVGDADLQCHSCGGIICGLEADWQSRCLAAEAELATVKADCEELRQDKRRLVCWREQGFETWNLRCGLLWLGSVEYRSVDYFASTLENPLGGYDSRDEAMTAVTKALGLPPCEVCDD
jgi:hypothetical protein